ncbi:PAS domain-containing protein [Bacillus salacetis]|uniref:histidine kinase n=1 Tax=Bacillus salacetis TaxID=2315464 RepID=A0A3A1R2Z1_9BACI|nr:ATP-binding protein [Bacillus salacetis]RIW33942.1 PAS domain-containing protein [Bacillus salacetis]
MISSLKEGLVPIELAELLKSGSAEVLLIVKGVKKYFEVKILPLGFEEGALITMYDITDRILLNRQRERYYDAIACGITVQDVRGRILYANPNAAEIIGVDKDEIREIHLKDHDWQLVDENGESLHLREHPWRKAIRTQQEIKNFVMGFYHPRSKEVRWVLVNTRNVFEDEEDSLEKVITTFHDITAKVQLDKFMKEKEKLALAGKLAAGVAHEIKNPLTSSLGFIKFMKDQKEVDFNYLDIVSRELESINAVTSEFLTLAEPQSLQREKICIIDDIILPLIEHMKEQLIERGTKINLYHPSDQILHGVKEQVTQLFLNILRNSMEAMPAGGNIDISMMREDKYIVVSIKDEGTGIPPERLKFLGEPFYSIKEKGTGFGLLLCKKIVHEHNGNLVIKSVVGKGTLVEVTLPVGEKKH